MITGTQSSICEVVVLCLLTDIHNLRAREQSVYRGGGDVYALEGAHREACRGSQGRVGQPGRHHPWGLLNPHYPQEVSSPCESSLFTALLFPLLLDVQGESPICTSLLVVYHLRHFIWDVSLCCHFIWDVSLCCHFIWDVSLCCHFIWDVSLYCHFIWDVSLCCHFIQDVSLCCHFIRDISLCCHFIRDVSLCCHFT